MSSPAARAAPGTLVVSNLEVVYKNAVSALTGVTLEVPPGGFTAVLGANGAGKTTLVRAITRLLFVHDGRVTGGSITYRDRPIGSAAADVVRAGICQVPEGRKLFSRLTVEENLRAGAATRRDAAGVDADLERMFGLFPQLAQRRRARAGFLSGGEQQMVAVGRALMARPSLLICDELSLGLAPLIVRELFDLLRKLNAEEGTSVLVIEQNARVALDAAAYGYVLENGRVAVQGTSAQLRDDPHVQELYLGGAGEAKEAYAAVVERYGAKAVRR